MTVNPDLIQAITDARGIVSAVWLDVHRLNENTHQEDENYRRLTSLTGAALDVMERALKICEQE